jgi:hypothetical protein
MDPPAGGVTGVAGEVVTETKQLPVTWMEAIHAAKALSRSAFDWQEGSVWSTGQVTTIAEAGGTTKVEVQLCESLASVTVYVKLRLAPVQEAPAGRAGTELIFVVAPQPPVKLKPVDQVV